MKSAAKVLHQTAKTCQYVKENAKKMHFFIKSEQAIDEIKREEEVVYSKYEEKQHPTPSPSLKGKELIEGIPE